MESVATVKEQQSDTDWESVKHGLQGRPGWCLLFVCLFLQIECLLEHSHTNSFKYFLWLLPIDNIRPECLQ